MPTLPTLTAAIVARANDGELLALHTVRAHARRALRLADLTDAARQAAISDVTTAILRTPGTPTASTIRQAARRALATVADTSARDIEQAQIIRDACRQVTHGYPTIDPELLHADVHLELAKMKHVQNPRGAARHIAKLALTRRLTADSAHGLGGESDARRGGGGLAQYLRQLTDATRTCTTSVQRAADALQAAEEAVQAASTDADRSIALARLDHLKARHAAELSEARNVFTYLDATREDGTSPAADLELVPTGPTGETELFARWRDALIDAAIAETGWTLTQTARAVVAFWDGALIEVQRGKAGFRPSLLSLAATLSRGDHCDRYAAEAGIPTDEWQSFVALLCGEDAVLPEEARDDHPAVPGRPARLGLLITLSSRPDLNPTDKAPQSLAPVTPLFPTIPHTAMEQAA